jgi:hypothetical protein
MQFGGANLGLRDLVDLTQKTTFGMARKVFRVGLDLVLEGDAVQASDEVRLQPVADSFAAKYERPFDFTASDLAELLVHEVAPATAFGFSKGETFSQTRWRFQGAK